MVKLVYGIQKQSNFHSGNNINLNSTVYLSDCQFSDECNWCGIQAIAYFSTKNNSSKYIMFVYDVNFSGLDFPLSFCVFGICRSSVLTGSVIMIHAGP